MPSGGLSPTIRSVRAGISRAGAHRHEGFPGALPSIPPCAPPGLALIVGARGPGSFAPCIANSLAMKLATVSQATPNPVGGGMERDANGELTGWFREGAGHRMISKAVPPPASEQEGGR